MGWRPDWPQRAWGARPATAGIDRGLLTATLEGRDTVEELAKQGVTAGRVATRRATTEGDCARDRRWSSRACDAMTTSNTGPSPPVAPRPPRLPTSPYPPRCSAGASQKEPKGGARTKRNQRKVLRSACRAAGARCAPYGRRCAAGAAGDACRVGCQCAD
jgi:hypothetical protein